MIIDLYSVRTLITKKWKKVHWKWKKFNFIDNFNEN
jgi:hypothetical protein